MSNLTENQRAQFERATYSGSSERIRHGSSRGAAVYSVFAAIVAVALCVLAATTIDGWAQFVVIGAIVATMLGFMIAVSPNRRA